MKTNSQFSSRNKSRTFSIDLYFLWDYFATNLEPITKFNDTLTCVMELIASR